MSALVARTAVVSAYLAGLAFVAPFDAFAALLAAGLVAVWAVPPLCRRCPPIGRSRPKSAK
jgi:hypothetical protein